MAEHPDLVLLHGANGSGAEMAPLAAALRPYARVHAPNLPGHGGRAVPDRFSISDSAADVAAWIERAGIEKPFVLGYSLGGYAALFLARHHAASLRGVATLAVKHVFDADTVNRWVYLSQTERLRGRPDRVAELERAHPAQDWSAITTRNAELFAQLGRAAPLDEAQLAQIALPVLAISSDRDQLVPWAETLALGRRIPGCEVAMFYGIAHPLAMVPAHPIARTVAAWMARVAARG
jgi:pimeloyl-ACP methyl ester carboxylesterase